MSERVSEILIEKITSLLDDLAQSNILIRKIESSKEPLSRINARIDATQTAVREIEKLLQGEVKEMGALYAAIGELKASVSTLQEQLTAVHAGIGGLPARISIPHEKIDALRVEVIALCQQLKMPLDHQVKHHHHLAKSSLLNIGFIFVILTLSFFLIQSLTDDENERANAFKYRWLEVVPDSLQRKPLTYLDSVYLADPSTFRHVTAEKEQQSKEAYEEWEKLNTEKEDVKEREERAKARAAGSGPGR